MILIFVKNGFVAIFRCGNEKGSWTLPLRCETCVSWGVWKLGGSRWFPRKVPYRHAPSVSLCECFFGIGIPEIVRCRR